MSIAYGPYRQTSSLFNTSGVFTWVVPQGVSLIFVDATAPGGPGAGGQASASTAGGGGGGCGEYVIGHPLEVTPGSTLTITIPATPAGGAIAAAGVASGNLTITGALMPFPALQGGGAGFPGGGVTTGVGGVGGTGSTGGQRNTGNAGAGVSASGAGYYSGVRNAGGGGGGGSTGASGGAAGNNGPLWNSGSGGSNGGGGGGANNWWGRGANGGAGGSPGSAPADGYGGGGSGGGYNSAGGGASPGFVRIRY